ncbi:hypothetical protein HPB50_010255 [Hyalomma asiaticum]|uniref:Uncharacterized protein n=1 Tax=Hyalomma asiaticum TaxID=266040 RepID=A0ACB7RHK3_HYAAI|nr:hypothetical protein HPB50_010255 [Hyalomma asiaticum]
MNRSPINASQHSPDDQRAYPVELTHVHQRSSRRLRGASPEFGPLLLAPRESQTTDAATMKSQASVRSVGAEARVSKSSVWRILKKRQLHPYHVQLQQALEPRDFQNRTDFAKWILIRTVEEPGFVNKALWTDEATRHFGPTLDRRL